MFSVFKDNDLLTETLKGYIDKKLSLPGSSKYAYTVISKKNPLKVLVISSYPEKWVEFYLANNFQLTDPITLTAFRRSSAFAWDENISMIPDKIFSMARQYNIINGMTFVLHDYNNNLALLSVIIGSHGKGELEEYLSTSRSIQQTLLIDINEQMYLLAQSTSARKRNGVDCADKALFTPRENEVLYLASMGKTYTEIAIITGISVSTVKFHIRNIVLKLGVNNARQAIRLGVELDLIKSGAIAAR